MTRDQKEYAESFCDHPSSLPRHPLILSENRTKDQIVASPQRDDREESGDIVNQEPSCDDSYFCIALELGRRVPLPEHSDFSESTPTFEIPHTISTMASNPVLFTTIRQLAAGISSTIFT